MTAVNESREEKLDHFFARIDRVKQAIAMHRLIADNSPHIDKYEDFFGTLQSQVLNRIVILELINIFNKNNNLTLEKIFGDLMDIELKSKLEGWRKIVLSLGLLRNKHVAHSDNFDVIDFQYKNPSYQLNYEEIWPVLNELQDVLVSISQKRRHKVREFEELVNFDPCLKDLADIIKLSCSNKIVVTQCNY